MVVAIANIAAGLFGIAFVFYLVRVYRRGAPDRDREDSARAYFDRHGHWPDEA